MEDRLEHASGDSASAAAASHSSAGASSHAAAAAAAPSRRVRVYNLQPSGTWSDLGIGWLYLGAEVPVQANDSEHVSHLIIQEDATKESAHAPVSSVTGLPSLTHPTLLSVHIPHTSSWGKQDQTILTFTMPFDASNQRAHDLHWKRANSGQQAPASSPPLMTDTIDIALSFKVESDAVHVWEYVHTFPEVRLQELEDSERQAMEEEEEQEEDEIEEVEDAPPAAGGHGRTLSIGISQHTGSASREEQSSPRTMSLLSEEQMDDTPVQPIAHINRSRWSDLLEDDDMDELTDPTPDQQRMQSSAGGSPGQAPRFFSNSGRPPPNSIAAGLQSPDGGMHSMLGIDYDDGEEEEENSHVVNFRAGNSFSIGRKGSDSRRHAHRRPSEPPQTPSESESEVDEDDIVFPRSLRLPTMSNMERIVDHLTSLMHPSLGGVGLSLSVTASRLVTGRSGRTRQVKHKAMQQATMTPFKRRQVLMGEITEKSTAYKRNLLICSAKKPVAIRAQRTPSPATNGGAAASPTVAPTAGTPVAAAAASVPSYPGASPPPAPVSSPSDLNWLENLSMLLRKVDEEIAWREEHLVDRRQQPPEPVTTDGTAAASTVDGSTATAAPASVPLTPETATLDELLRVAQQIQESVSLLFSFNTPGFMAYLFDVSSVHSFYYQWYLVITAYEYEGALERRRQALEARKVTQANTSHLWRRHRAYLDSVVLKSPFPLQMTHVLDLPAFEQAAASPDSVPPSQLSTAPTKFCLLLLSSYILPYIRDTFLYSPRALDDPIQMSMNQSVVFKNLNLLMNGIIQDGDSQALAGTTTGSGMGFGGRRTNLRGGNKNRKSISLDEATPKWTKHVFGRIVQLIDEEERKMAPFQLPLVAPNDSPVAVGSAADLAAAPSQPNADAANSTSTKPAAGAAAATTNVSPAVYAMVSRSTKDWCPLLSMNFCSSLADYLYALHHLFALTKNGNNANGVVPMQKEKLMTKLIDDGFLPCIELVLLFCKRQQQRLQDGGISQSAFSAPIARGADGSMPPIPSSSYSSPSTITWMRLLCLDFLSTLQNAQPGFMRRFMEAQVQHVNTLTHSSGGNLMTAALSGEEHQSTDGDEDHQDQQQPQAAISPLERNKYWKLEHEKCRAARRQLSSTIKSQPGSPVTGSGEALLPPISDSLLMLVFQMMADPQSYIGVRQTASSLLRLCLDPEFGGLMQLPRAPFEPQFVGQSNGSNPLVALLALGGIGSSAARQLHFDGASSEEEESPESNDLVGSVMTQFGGQRRRPPTAAQKADMEKRRLAERKQKRRDMKARIKGRQKMIVEDTLLHLVYATDANAMVRVVELLRAASNQWTMLSSANAGITPAQVQSFVQSFPPPLLIDCIDLLSFFALRHSIVFQEFVITSKVFKLLAAFFPHPQLTPAEQAKEKKRAEVLAAKNAAQQAAGEDVKPPVPTASTSANHLSAMSPIPSPSPSPSPPADASSSADVPFVFQAPRTDAPSGILCAILRFLRITLEIDAVFVQPIQSSHILLRMVELFLHNLRPNLVHSSILEVIQFIETKKVSALVGQLLHGNSYVQMSIEADARKKALKMQSRLEQQAIRAKAELKPEDHGMSMQIDAAPDVPVDSAAQSSQSNAPHEPSSSGVLPPAFVLPTLPEAPEHAGTPSSSAPLSLPFLSSAYGISRVSHLAIWPSGFKVLCSRRQRHLARASSDAATEVTGESPGQHKRRRASDEAEEADDSPTVKRTKLHNGVGGASYSGSELESGSSSLSEDSSDLDTSSTSTSDSDDTADAAPGRTSLFSEEDETTTMEEEPDQDENSAPGNYQQQRENALAQDQFDFDHWQEPAQAEQKSSAHRPHQGDTEDVDMFAEEASDGVDSAAELEAANRRLADIEARRKAEREEREAAEQASNSFGVKKTSTPFENFVGAARSAASGLIGGLLGGPKKPQMLSFSIGGPKPAPAAAAAPSTTEPSDPAQADLPEWLTRLKGSQEGVQPSP